MIRFVCSCGKQLQTEDEFAGRQVVCPACGNQVPIPNPAQHIQSRQPEPMVGAIAEETAPSRSAWIIGGIVAGGAVLVSVVIVLVIALGGGGEAPRDDEPIARDAAGGGDFSLNPVQKVREAAARTASANNLRQIGLAPIDYADSHQRILPPAAVYDKNGKALYSWRVLILPFIEQGPVYKQFHLDEPWDSPHNSSLLSQMPKVYASPTDPSQANTHYLVFDSPGCAFD